MYVPIQTCRWNLDEVRSGDAFRYYFNTAAPTTPVAKPWNETSQHYRKHFASILSYTRIQIGPH